MDTNHTSSGWLTWRFFGLSGAFWILYQSLQVLLLWLSTRAAEFAEVEFGKDLFLQVTAYWLATPLLFEVARRLGQGRRSAASYYLRLAAVGIVAAAVHALLFVLMQWDASWLGFIFLSLITTWAFHYFAILGCAVAVNQFRFAELRRRELLQAQLRALRSQLQPHFLFNTLQAIAVTTRRDADAAVGMLTLLGDLLRQTLQDRPSELVSLAEEQEMLRPYLELQQLRFADRLTVDIDFPVNVLGASVPDLILQPLVENALQHGIERMPGAGTVRIRARRHGDRLELEVADDGAGPDGNAVEDGVGLGVTRARLKALFGDRADLSLAEGSRRGSVVTVRMPWQEVSGAA